MRTEIFEFVEFHGDFVAVPQVSSINLLKLSNMVIHDNVRLKVARIVSIILNFASKVDTDLRELASLHEYKMSCHRGASLYLMS